MNTALRDGLLGGGILCLLFFAPFFIVGPRPEWLRVSEVVGYATMFLCLSATFLAMRREHARRGPLSYGAALGVGIGVSGVAALMFGAATWAFLAHAGDALPEVLIAHYTRQIHAAGGGPEVIAAKLAELEAMRPLLHNHPLQAAVMTATVFLIGAVESLVGALVLTRRGGRPAAA